uniref:t-SNARE coiled-coil homology domain-containing protein n=1 Tax=Strigamia maritima TaxID=126957 RepID=T1IZZ4_STRMM
MADKGYAHTTYGSIDTPQVAFVDPTFNPTEFSSLCDNISSNIYVVQSNASILDRSQKQIGSPTDNATFREKLQDVQQRTNQLIALTTQYLQQATTLSKTGEKSHKVQAERLRNEFQSVVKRYWELQKQVVYKIKASYFKSTPSKMELTSPATDWSEGSDQTQLLDNMAAQQQAQRQVQRDFEAEHDFVMDRDERIRQIEGDMLDANDIFRTLAGMVAIQGQDIDSIGRNIEQAGEEVDGAEQQLIQAASYQRKFRRNLFCLLGVLFTVAIIIIIVVVLTVKT